MEYIIFEDMSYLQFLPFTYTRITGDMRVGILKLRQKIGLHWDFLPHKLVVRNLLRDLYLERHPEWQINNFPANDYLFINSRLRISHKLAVEIDNLNVSERLLAGEDVIAFRVVIDKNFTIDSETITALYSNLKVINSGIKDSLWSYPEEFVQHNGKEINNDYELIFYEEGNFIAIEPGVIALNPYQIWVGENAILGQGVILDATKGAVIIDQGAEVMHNSVLIGPVYIGKNSIIKIGSKIYPNTSIGPHCKVGGEVEDTIIQAYSNKQHDGFLGNSYIGEWVNIGAGTSNSDLKNNYNNVKMWDFTQQKKRETGLVFLGALIGDHCKLGINSTINTGTTICYGSSIYGKKLICGQTPPFSWVEDNKISLYDLEKLLDTIEKVKQRRGEKLSDIERNVMHKLYKEITKMEKKDD